MSRDVVDDLAASGRVADVDGVVEIEMGGQGGQVIGVMVHVVTAAGLRGAAVPTAVVGNHPVAMVQEEQHLGVPIVSRKGPTVTEDDRLA